MRFGPANPTQARNRHGLFGTGYSRECVMQMCDMTQCPGCDWHALPLSSARPKRNEECISAFEFAVSSLNGSGLNYFNTHLVAGSGVPAMHTACTIITPMTGHQKASIGSIDLDHHCSGTSALCGTLLDSSF